MKQICRNCVHYKKKAKGEKGLYVGYCDVDLGTVGFAREGCHEKFAEVGVNSFCHTGEFTMRRKGRRCL